MKVYKFENYLFLTRLLGRFAPIFYFNCEHFLFVYIVKQKQKNSVDLLIKIRVFSKLYVNLILVEANFLNFNHP